MPWIEVPDFQPKRPVQARAQAQGERRWYTIRNAASADEAELLLYDEIGGWFGATADQFVDDLKAVTAPNIRVRINSPGGSVFEGLAIANALRAHPANVTAQIDGLAASIASVIAMAGDRLVMMPNSMLMIHDASGLCVGDAAEMTKMAEVLGLISDNIADVYATKAGGTREQWRDTMRAETWYLPEDAVKAGLADEAVPGKAPAEGDPEMHAAYDPAVYGYHGPAQPERPKPGPPPAKAQTEEPAPAALTISLGDAVGEQLVAALRASVKANAAIADTASSVHHTATTDAAWDGPAAVAAMPNEESVLRYCHAWYDPDGDPDAKASYRFPHHKTKGGPANLAACRNGLARLDGSNIPDSEKAGVRRHLQAHLDDAKGNADDTAPAEALGEHGQEPPSSDPRGAGESGAPDAEPAPMAVASEPAEPTWADVVSRLTNGQPTTWAGAIQRLTRASSSSATES